jgi:hypothetical protein
VVSGATKAYSANNTGYFYANAYEALQSQPKPIPPFRCKLHSPPRAANRLRSSPSRLRPRHLFEAYPNLNTNRNPNNTHPS